MTVRLETIAGTLRLVDDEGELPSSIMSSLRLQGFVRGVDGLVADVRESSDLVMLVQRFVRDAGVQIEVDQVTEEIIRARAAAHRKLEESRSAGREIKNADLERFRRNEFVEFLARGLNRPLLSHQAKAALHMVSLAHSANFSVPGAGKTAVVLAAYEFQRKRGVVTSLFVVGPRSCFVPWQTEFELTLGRQPRVEVLAGGDIGERHRKYYPRIGEEAELYLTTYHTLARDKERVQHLLRSRNNQAFFVIDEAHYMKQDEGIWAKAVAEACRDARKRCVLTGTPFPKSYADGLNQFEVLYPDSGIFTASTKGKIRHASNQHKHQEAREHLEPIIDSLYYRVRKCDLNLSEPIFIPPIQVTMNPVERELYDCIEKRIADLERDATEEDLDTIIQLKKGRQIRRRQATSYSALLLTAISGYDERLIDPNNECLNEKIRNYDAIETPAKIQRLLQEVRNLRDSGEKVVVWANFVGTLYRIKEECDKLGSESRIVYGGTPTEEGMDEESRETIIERFKSKSSGLDILIANPAACAESVSLHKTCSNAIYYDLSYNCAEYLQSLDRIHRVGGSEQKLSYYRFLQCADTFEYEILANLTEKATRMSDVVDQDFPLALCELANLGIDENGFID